MNLSNNGKKLSDFLDEKMMEQSFTNEDLVHFIEQVGRYLNLETLPNYAVKHKMSYNGVKKHRQVQEIFKVKFVIDND